MLVRWRGDGCHKQNKFHMKLNLSVPKHIRKTHKDMLQSTF